LTYHRTNQTLRCHFCDRREKPPDTCPRCRSKKFLYLAHGTQKVEAELKNLFPGTRFERMDTDTTRGKLASFHLLDRFARREFDLLLGTQMIAKGLDFPDVGLVGVVSADLSLHLPDFRAKEKTFQLLTQVAGRTGRGDRPGQVLIQTYAPDEPVIQQAAQHDYRSFYQQEIGERLSLAYPPFSRLIALIFRSKQEKTAEQAANLFAKKIKKTLAQEKGQNISILGPAPAPFYRLRKEFRWRVTLKARRVSDILPTVGKILDTEPAFRPRPLLRITVDVDPQDLL
jgi:primosomal protein N' (replication factor Y)